MLRKWKIVDVIGFSNIISNILNALFWTYLGRPRYVGPRNKEGACLAYAIESDLQFFVNHHCNPKKKGRITLKGWKKNI